MCVTERRSADGKRMLPYILSRRAGDVGIVHRYMKDDGTWGEGMDQAFDSFSARHARAARPMAAVFDGAPGIPGTDHPAVFAVDKDGQLFYVEATGNPKQWTKSAALLGIRDPRVAGDISAVFDLRGKKPACFYRSEDDGVLCYVYWREGRFHVSALRQMARVGGALSAFWDPGADDPGHPSVTYVRGDGAVEWVFVRNMQWQSRTIPLPTQPGDAGCHADPQMIAAVRTYGQSTIGVFWGLVRYEEREIEDEPPPRLKYWEAQPAELRFTHLLVGFELTTQRLTVDPKGPFAAGRISAGSALNALSPHRDGPLYEGVQFQEANTEKYVSYQRGNLGWVRVESGTARGPVFSATAADGKSILSVCRQADRSVGFRTWS
jgi:hypothetical protein